VWLAVQLAGCASVNFVTEIPASLRVTPVSPAADAGRGLVVAVHWPAALDPKARDAVDQYSQSYWRAAFGSIYDDPVFVRTDVTGGLPIASTYAAAEAFMALRRALPGASVVLEPQMISFDDRGRLTEKSMLPSAIPVAMRLDIAAPQGGKFPFINENFTFSIRTQAAWSAGNCGLFTASAAETDAVLVWPDGNRCEATGQAFPSKPVWYLNRA